MKVLLAGASGAIGIPLTRQLVAAGHEVIGLSRTTTNHGRLRALGAEELGWSRTCPPTATASSV